MSRFRKDVKDNFTVIHNDFIKDKRLGWGEKGLLLTLMQLPDDWNYSVAGLAALTPDGTYKVSKLLKKLNAAGYFRRIRLVDSNGRVVDWIYEFSDQVHEEWISSNDDTFIESEPSNPPQLENPHVDNPHVDEQPQSNKNKLNNKYIDSDQTNNEIEKEVKNNIQYDRLCSEYGENIILPITRVILENMTSSKKMLKVNKKKLPKQEVRAKLAMLRYEHICQLIKNIQKTNANPVWFNAYILTSLYNIVTHHQTSENNFFELIKQRVTEISEHSYNLDLLMDYALKNTPKIRIC
jgi:hypothetical protein